MRKTKFEFASASRRLNLLIGKTCDFLSKNGQDSIREAMMAELESVKQRKYIKIAFVGQYSSGKSTIISALTGNRDIKIDANVATEIVSEYEWNSIVLMDTPGISAGKKEEHDQRTMQALKECDLIVYVLTSQLFDNLIFNDYVKMACRLSRVVLMWWRIMASQRDAMYSGSSVILPSRKSFTMPMKIFM